MYIHELEIGKIKLENNILLAPMAGITDLPFRIIAKKQGAGLVYTEMISSKAIFYQDEKTKKLLNMKGEKRPVGVQIFGSDLESMVSAAKYIEPIADVIDINMGCPAPKVVKNGDGSKLLLNLELAEQIVKEVVKAVHKPVTVKMRKGWNHQHVVAVEAAKRFERAGASLLTIHGRTREDYYSGTCDLEIIKQVKQAVNIPVIGNGDVRDIASAKKMFDATGVDGIMIGRASLGNPWIFRSILQGLRQDDAKQERINQPLTKSKEYLPSHRERLNTILEHLDLAIQEKGEYIAIREMRKHIAGYTKNLPNSSSFRSEMNQIEDKEKLIQYVSAYLNSIPRE